RRGRACPAVPLPRRRWRETAASSRSAPTPGRSVAGWPMTRRRAASAQRWDALTVTLVDPVHDRSRDLLGLHGHLERIAHVTRPLHRAHPHHLLGGAFVPAPSGLTGEVLADPGPHRLGVHQD